MTSGEDDRFTPMPAARALFDTVERLVQMTDAARFGPIEAPEAHTQILLGLALAPPPRAAADVS